MSFKKKMTVLNSICRCCHSLGVFKNIQSTHKWMEKDENYSQMIIECFNVELFPLDKLELQSSICEICISQLRAALRFRQQMMQSEIILFEKIKQDDNNIKVQLNETKNEFIKKEDDDDDESNKNMDFVDNSDDLDYTESQEELKPQKRKILKENNNDKSEISDRMNAIATRQNGVYNATTLIENSNIVIFKWNSVTGFSCIYCNKVFTDTMLLIKHSKTHTHENLKKLLSVHYGDSLIKADITDLHCRLCSESMPDLQFLKYHLMHEHSKTFTEWPDLIVPFKLPSDNYFVCQLCHETFVTFVQITTHMNLHFSTAVCEICGATFISKSRLRMHTKYSHQEKSYKCPHCSKIYRTKPLLNIHIRYTHMGIRKFKCHCGEVFTSFVARRRHAVAIHNAEHIKSNCEYCTFSFISKSALNRHLKRVHLGQKSIPCPECNRMFFSKGEINKHMITHTKERNFGCTVCDKKYTRKYVLQQHMRIHNDEKNFVCSQCGEAFVQKCSLKYHINKHHL